jgi:hypothetical protein
MTEQVKITADATNLNNRRLHINGDQWCKVYGFSPEDAQARAETIAAALSAQPHPLAVDGWKLVPVEPTREMELAGKHTIKGADTTFERELAILAYRSMLAAAPQPPSSASLDQVHSGGEVVSDADDEDLLTIAWMHGSASRNDEVRALTARIKRLEDALETILSGVEDESDNRDGVDGVVLLPLYESEIRKARAALNEGEW